MDACVLPLEWRKSPCFLLGFSLRWSAATRAPRDIFLLFDKWQQKFGPRSTCLSLRYWESFLILRKAKFNEFSQLKNEKCFVI
jgi:hypothetical protein